MERRNQDCYFYYYSTCTKGDRCVFRHEPAARGCETMCPYWEKRTCMNVHCSLRHMQLRKNRKLIPCYWENKPGGCMKQYCPFQHKNPGDSHQINEMEKEEYAQQGKTSQAPHDRGDWPHRDFNQPEEGVRVTSNSGRIDHD